MHSTRFRSAGAAMLSAALAAGLAAAPARAIILPANFVAEDVAPGAGFVVPTSIAFMPDGRLLVAEKQGRVWVVKNGVKNPVPMWQSQAEVLDEADRGLLGVAVDPNHAVNRYVYLLYTVDPDSNGVDDGSDGFGRLVRYQTSLADSNVVDPATRTILMGTGWRDAPIIGSPSHTVGALRWGTDGSLFVSTGDGAQFNDVDDGGADPEMFGPAKADPYEDIGAYRSQNLWSLAGKLLRLDPATGLGYASNPFYDGNPASVRSRVWAYGIRNSFRFGVRPGSGLADPALGRPGVVYMGEVGWTEWEEMNVTAPQGGNNFGWPCYEGFGVHFGYSVRPPSHGGCDSVGTFWNPSAFTPPLMSWNHLDPNLSQPPGFRGNAAVGGAFYTGTSYPGLYRNRYFLADYGNHWIQVVVTDSLDQLVTVLPFATESNGPVDLVADPVSGDLHYVSIWDFVVYRIRYTGGQAGNQAPDAVASGVPAIGSPPLEVAFSSAGTFDLDGDTLAYAWTFGDGFGSTDPNPVHTYVNYGAYTAILTVDDGHGGIGRDSVTITVAENVGFPSTGILDDFDRPDGPIGGAWSGGISGLAIQDSALIHVPGGAYGTTVWSGASFDSTQEAYVTLLAITPTAPEHDVLLKVQGTTTEAAHIEVRWDAVENALRVATYEPGVGWIPRAGPIALTLQPGDRFGARARGNGQVEIYANGVAVATADCSTWPYAASGGYIGLGLDFAYASRLDDFGGGTVSYNTPPTAGIAGAADSSFYALGDTLTLTGVKSDAEDPPPALAGHFRLLLNHNNHFHIEADLDGDTALMVPVDHEDGTGVHYEARYWVTDTGGLRDTAVVRIYPETDLAPSAVEVDPPSPSIHAPATYTFRIHNLGRMQTRRTAWRLLAGSTALAGGDTALAALDSVTISVSVPPLLAVGTYDLRVVCDTLALMPETDEANNAWTGTLVVVDGPLAAGDGPPRLALSNAFPNPARGRTAFALELPAERAVGFEVLDVQGRVVWSAGTRRFGAGRHRLEWDGRAASGGRAAPGLYLARVSIEGEPARVRRVVTLD